MTLLAGAIRLLSEFPRLLYSARMPDLDLAYTPAVELARRIRAREISSVELVQNSLDRIDEVNGRLNCFCFVWREEALAAARAADAMTTGGTGLGVLHGLPIALKDTTPTAGMRTTLGSYTHEHWIPEKDAHIAVAMRRAGAVVVGKTNSPEFAHTLVTDSPLWGPTRNPWNLELSPGGSSGGSAAAVAAGCVALAEGSDMGGSVRIPASWCGVVGLKPGIGRIPMDTLPGLFDSISHHGPLARTVDDARLFLAAAQGPDESDIMSVTTPLDLTGSTPSDVRGMRFGLSLHLGNWAVDASVEAAVRHGADALVAAGAVVEEVDLRITKQDDLIWEDLWAVFMAAYYGHLLAEFSERMDPTVVGLIQRGNSLSAVHMKRLELARSDIWRRVSAVLAGHDALLCPTTTVSPLPASKADRRPPAPRTDGRHDATEMTAIFNLVAPCPAISVPCGRDSQGMPVGLQVVGRRWREDTVLRVARAVELGLPPLGRPPI